MRFGLNSRVTAAVLAVSLTTSLSLSQTRASFGDSLFIAVHYVEYASDTDERHRLANLIWSAKESALKVLKTGLRRDTRSVEVQHEESQPAAWARLRIRSEEGATFPGWWRQYGQFLLTVVATVDLPPPVSLQGPPRLQDAVPTHAWLAAPLV